MKSNFVASGQTGYSEQYDSLVADAKGGAGLLAHQQLGVLALGTNPGNTKTATLTINGTAIVFTFVSSIGSTPGNVLIGASAAATCANLLALLQNPQTTTATGVALSSANQALIVFCGYALSGTSITIYSLNNATYAPQTSFTASTTATSDTYTANTMALYIEPGTYYLGITKVIFAGGNTGTITAPSTHPRIDIVTLDNAGTIAMTQGSEAVSPSAPAYPANKIVVCEIFNTVGETIIKDWNDGSQGYVSNDVRPEIAPAYISDASQFGTGVVPDAALASTFIKIPGSSAQGDILYFDGSIWNRLPHGISGQFLQTKGAAANPQWATTGQRLLLIGTTAGDYATSSNSFVDVDGTNLTGTLSSLGNNQVITVAYSFQMKDGVSGTAFWQIVEKNSGLVLASGSTSSTTFVTYQGLIQWPGVGTSYNISLQFKQNSGVNATINNGAGSGQFVTPSILIYA